MFPDDDIDNIVLDTHYYTCYIDKLNSIEEYCDSYKTNLAEASKIKYEVWVGEWSLATDKCALWLGGF